MSMSLESLKLPISLDYSRPSQAEIESILQWGKRPITLGEARMELRNEYFAAGLAGSLAHIYLREALVERLRRGIELLPESYSLIIFDGFRTLETQKAIFKQIYNEVKNKNPHLDETRWDKMTRTFVVHPEDISGFPVAPHNSGGAVDLSLAFEGVPLDMGTGFDEAIPLSFTSAFEGPCPGDGSIEPQRWERIRHNRRLLFNLMKGLGFTNYAEEWWHYDLLDCMYAKIHHLDTYFPSMESEILDASLLPA